MLVLNKVVEIPIVTPIEPNEIVETDTLYSKVP